MSVENAGYKLTPQQRKEYYQNALVVSSFLGGITFAALVLVMQSPDKFTLGPSYSPVQIDMYRQTLISGMALTSVLFVFASIKLIGAASTGEASRITGGFLRATENGGFAGLMVLLPMLLYPFSALGTGILIAVEVVAAILAYLVV